jgi:hypothetical protein
MDRALALIEEHLQDVNLDNGRFADAILDQAKQDLFNISSKLSTLSVKADSSDDCSHGTFQGGEPDVAAQQAISADKEVED